MLEENPASYVNNNSLMVVGQLTCTVLWLLVKGAASELS